MIVVGIQLILFIVFIVSVHNVGSIMNKVYNNNKYYYNNNNYYIRNLEQFYLKDFEFIFEEQKQAIDTCFAFFIISFTIFISNSLSTLVAGTNVAKMKFST